MLSINPSIKPINKRESDIKNKQLPLTSSNSEKINKKCKFFPKLPTIHPNIVPYPNFISNAEYLLQKEVKVIQIILIKDTGITSFNT